MTKKHEHGSMDISEQEKTFAGFVKFSIWGAALTVAVLVFLALTNA